MRTLFLTTLALCCIQNAFSASLSPNYERIRPYFLDSSADFSTLKLVQTLHRHGDRNFDTDDTFPKDPYRGTKIGQKARGQLTSVGKQMGYELGRYLRARYDGWLAPKYSISEFVAFSSDVDRTLQTCLSMLAGLFPPIESDPESRWHGKLDWQPIPIHTRPTSADKVILQYAPCPKLTKLQEQTNNLRSVEFDQNATYQNFYSFLSKNTGSNITNVKEAFNVIDALIVYRAHGYSLPIWTNEPGFWIKAAEINHEKFSRTEGRGLQQALRAGPFVTELIHFMDLKRQEIETNTDNGVYSTPKFRENSGHDSTVFSILEALQINNLDSPPYASVVLFELHKPVTEGNMDNYFIKIFYRNETNNPAYELQVPNCGNPCYLDTFKRINAHLIITDQEWDEKCKS